MEQALEAGAREQVGGAVLAAPGNVRGQERARDRAVTRVAAAAPGGERAEWAAKCARARVAAAIAKAANNSRTPSREMPVGMAVGCVLQSAPLATAMPDGTLTY